jgi:hypothetical protein
VSEEDLQHLSPNQLQDSYDVELAPLESIEAWIHASRDLRAAVNLNPNVRRSAQCSVKKTCYILVTSNGVHSLIL